jgi:serine/threonine protein kinase
MWARFGRGVVRPEKWNVNRANGFGVESCYEAVIKDPDCAKDYFTYVARGDENCGCRTKMGRATPKLLSENSIRHDDDADYYKIAAGITEEPCVMFKNRLQDDIEEHIGIAGVQAFELYSHDAFQDFCARKSERLGSGSNANVDLGHTEADRSIPKLLALKSPKEQGLDREKFLNEVSILGRLYESEHIVRLYGYNDAEETLAMELLTGGSLQKKHELGYFPLPNDLDTKKIVQQIVDAVADCHRLGVAHRDLKEEQFVFKKPTRVAGAENWGTPLKLVDFGESRRLTGITALIQPWAGLPLSAKLLPAGSQWSDQVGSYAYLSPEVAWNGVIQGGKGELKAFSLYAPDIWAVGVMTFQVVTGQIFLEELSKQVEAKKAPNERKEITSSTPVFSLLNRLVAANDQAVEEVISWLVRSQMMRAFLKQCLRVDPAARATASELSNHPWLAS